MILRCDHVTAGYGDRRVLEKHYPAMERFIAFTKNRSTPDLLPPEKVHCFGDWLSIRADTPKDVIYTAYFAYSTALPARAAGPSVSTMAPRKMRPRRWSARSKSPSVGLSAFKGTWPARPMSKG